MKSMFWEDNTLNILDQTKLPHEVEYIRAKDVDTVAEAICRLSVRGAPAIGAAAAYGLVLGALNIAADDANTFFVELKKISDKLLATRPTAVNLKWALERLMNKAKQNLNLKIDDIKQVLLDEANRIFDEDIETNKKIGEYGCELIPNNAVILTHCNAGALATAGFGTALGVVKAAHYKNKNIHVYSCETRPLLQGARLTVWEMLEEGIPVTLITDSMAGYLMACKKVDLVIVGADRIALNGDGANKIGTYSLAVLAKEHKIPFYVAAPSSTIDFELDSGKQIPIEERSHEEVTHIGGVKIAADGVRAWNPAFDVTPNELIDAIITELGVIRKPYKEGIERIKTMVRCYGKENNKSVVR